MVQWWVRLLAFIVAEGLGLSFIVWTRKFVTTFPRSRFAEEHLGGTDNLYKFAGVILVVLGIFFLVGALDFLLGGAVPFTVQVTPTAIRLIK